MTITDPPRSDSSNHHRQGSTVQLARRRRKNDASRRIAMHGHRSPQGTSLGNNIAALEREWADAISPQNSEAENRRMPCSPARDPRLNMH